MTGEEKKLLSDIEQAALDINVHLEGRRVLTPARGLLPVIVPPELIIGIHYLHALAYNIFYSLS